MTPSAEALLLLLIPALYLKDSLLLLAPNEAVLVLGLGGRWRAGFGTRSWRLAGKELYIANPFLPHQPVVRLRWQLDAASSLPATPTVPVQAMRLGVFAWIGWVMLFLVIPAVLTGRGAGVPMLGAVGLLYANIVASLIVTWRWRRPLGVPGKAFAVLAFECIACAPYSVNLVRRVAALRTSDGPIDEDFIAAAERLLLPAAMNMVRRECLARVDEQIEIEDPDSPAAALLRQARLRFVVVEDADDAR